MSPPMPDREGENPQQNPLNDPEPPEDHFDSDECWQCGGEGYVFDCWDGCCIDADVGCDDCTRPCDICAPSKKTVMAP